MKKRILSLILAILMVISSFPAPILAVDGTATSETDSVVEKLVKVKESFSGWVNTVPGVFGGVVCDANSFPERLVITAVETVNGTVYYQLSSATGSWPIHSNLADGYWMKASDVEFIETPSQPGTTISGTVTDAEGNPVLDANGNPLEITVTGDGIPEGASVVASMPVIDEMGEGKGLFNIKILANSRSKCGNNRCQLIIAVNLILSCFFNVKHFTPKR